ncbi:MAG: PAS domain-containing protein [Candidatus Hydrogenedens sp.]|nr:PAS domain-containing protein [Candidatus Hydrogenedens sp.]
MAVEAENVMDELRGKVDAIDKTQAVIEFNLDGTIITANDNFLHAMGYMLSEIQGQHHRIFVEPDYANSPAYRAFWAKLAAGEFDQGEYKRIGKGGKEVWILATYNPIFDRSGKPYKVVKFATDITAQKLRNADFGGQVEAIGKSQAVIEFKMDGTIITANENFLKTMGYTLSEIQGRHHRLFVEAAYADSPEYRDFWDALNRGEYRSAQYKRIGQGGREVWIQASYNPILDPSGRPFKVVKYATDITQQTVMNLRFRKGLVELIEACTNGDLSKRGDASSLDEVYAPLMEGTNQIIDAICAPIAEAADVLERVGDRELDVRITGDYQGDHAAIKNNLNRALDALESALQEVNTASSQVYQASSQIASSSQSLADGASTQASSLEQVSASLEELTSMTSLNADNATQANSMASQARDAAQQGNLAMEKMMTAITSIKESSDQSAKIIKTIDQIAFQTNLLALNAAVEAARAGEAGKGFAVVAEEVRNLAVRSAEAAKNTTEMIEGSVKYAEGGVAISEQVGKALSDIVERSEKVSNFIAEIATASKEQASGLEEINKAVRQMDQITQSNSANSEETASAALELNTQSESLTEIIARFKISPAHDHQPQYVPAVRGGAAHAAPRALAAAPQRGNAMTHPRGSGSGNGGPERRHSRVIPLTDEDLRDF